MFLKLLLISIILLSSAFILLAVKIIFLKEGRFPNTSVGSNKKIKQMGITCIKCEEQAKFNRIRKHKVQINPDDLKVVYSLSVLLLIIL